MDISEGDFGEKPEGFDTLKINKEFASRFEHNAKRKFLEKGKAKYGKDLDAPLSSSESSSSEDDSDAELLNPRVEKSSSKCLQPSERMTLSSRKQTDHCSKMLTSTLKGKMRRKKLTKRLR